MVGDGGVALARGVTRDVAGTCSPTCVHAAELVASELVTNALLHGGGRAAVRVVTLDGGVRIEVADASPHAPFVGQPSSDAMTGRGLALVARLARGWGVEPQPKGKVIWAEVVDGWVPTEDRTQDELLAAWADPFDGDVSTVHVTLGEVPTALLVAAKRHVDNLVREFALAAGGDRLGTTAPVPAPLAELVDRVVHRFTDARLAIKRQATAAARAGARHTVLELDLPVGAADAAEEYVDALDEIDDYCRANRLLTLETPPQHRVFRRWYVGEIVSQLRAAQAHRERPPVFRFEDRLLAEVDVAQQARRAADRAARLHAVALALASAETEEAVAQAVLEEGVQALRAAGGGVLLATDADSMTVPATLGYGDELVRKLRAERRDAELPAAYALRTGEAVWLETNEERDARFPELAGLEPDAVATCAVPLWAGRQVVGALRFSFSDRRLFDADERQFVTVLAAEASEALRRTRLLASEREARRQAEHQRASLERLAAVGEAMLRGRDLDTILQLATDAATQGTGAEFGAFFYNAVDEAGERYLLYALSGAPREAFERFPMPRNTAIFGPTFSGERIVRLDDVTADPAYGRNPPHHGIPEGHLPVRSYLAVPVALSTGEVIGGLFFGHGEPGRFDHDAERLAVGVAGQTAAAVENVRSLEERARVAAVLQRSLLPAALPTVDGLDLGAAYAAAGEGVGGDYYDAFRLDDRRWVVAMGDVRGRGPEAAAVTGLVRYTIRTAVLLGSTPAGALTVLDEALAAEPDDDERFCSAVCAVVALHDAGADVVYASAGHPPAAVVRAGSVDWLPPTGPLAGIVEGATFEEGRVALGPGDALVLFTDGISEARRDGTEFGEAGLAEALAATRGRPAQAVADDLTAAARAFASGAATDDAAVLVVVVGA